MMLKKYAIGLLPLFFMVQLHAQDARRLAFIDSSLDDFINRVITQEEDRNQFKAYYANLAQKIHEAKEKDPKKERATYRYLYQIAFDNLQKKHADWYEEIAPFVNDVRFTLDDQLEDVRKVIRFFLTRYGAYEEFLNFKVAREQKDEAVVVAQNEQGGLWNSVLSFVSDTTSKVAGFFGFGKSDKVSA